MLTTIARVGSRANKNLKIAGVVPTMYDNRTGQGSQSLQSITNSLSKIGTIYSAIPRSVVFADAAQEHIPLALYNSKHPSVKILK